MNELEIQQIEAEVAVRRILSRKNGGIELFQLIFNDLVEREMKLSAKESNLQSIIMNIKPEYIEEMKKLINEEIFESLGLSDSAAKGSE